MSLKDQIQTAMDLPSEPVSVPEWDLPEGLFMRSLTARERDDYEASMIQTSGSGKGIQITPSLSNAKAKFVCLCLVDAEGKRVFESEAEGAKVLGGKAAQILNRLFEVASRLSGMSAEDLEELEKNSGTIQGDSSG